MGIFPCPTVQVAPDSRIFRLSVHFFPVFRFLLQFFALGIFCKCFRPVLAGGCFCRKNNFLPLQRLFIPGSQVFQKDSPGYAVHDKMVQAQQQMVAIRSMEQSCFHQGPAFQVHTALYSCTLSLCDFPWIVCILKFEFAPVIQFAFRNRQDFLPVCPVHAAQYVMMDCKPFKALFERFLIKAVPAVKHQGLIKMIRLCIVPCKEGMLDRCQQYLSADFSLFIFRLLPDCCCLSRDQFHGTQLHQVFDGQFISGLPHFGRHADCLD